MMQYELVICNQVNQPVKCKATLSDPLSYLIFRYHMTPLIYAAREGREEVVTKLLDAGANINKQDSRGWTVS